MPTLSDVSDTSADAKSKSMKKTTAKESFLLTVVFLWRREQDSNLRGCYTNTISSRAP